MNRSTLPVEKRIASGSIAASCSFVVSLLLTVIQVPVLLHFWNVEQYGIWMAIGAAASLVTALDIGHQSFVGNLLNCYWIDNKKKLRVVLASGVLIAIGIATIEMAVGILLIIFGRAEWLSGSSHLVPGDNSFRIAFLAYLVFWVANGSVGGILVRLYQPAGFFARSQILGMIYRLAGFIALVVAAASGASIAIAMLAQIGAWVLCNLFTFWDIRRKFPEYYPWWRGSDLMLGFHNFKSSLVLTINGLFDQLTSSGLVLLVAGVLLPVEVAVFTTIRTVANTALQGISVLLFPIMPDVVRYHYNREHHKITAVFSVSWCVASSLVCIGFSAGAPFIEPLYRIWTRKTLPFDPALFSLVAVAVSLRQWSAPLQTYFHSINLLPPQTIPVVMRACITLAMSASFLRIGGIRIAGLSLMMGEFVVAIYSLFSARRCIRDLGGILDILPVLLSCVQIIIMGTGLFIYATFSSLGLCVAFISTFMVLILACFQWIILPNDARLRLSSLIGFKKKTES